MDDNIPVLYVSQLQIGPLGVTLGEVDAGGGAGSELLAIPLITVTKWFDHRQTCPRVVAFVQFGETPELTECRQYNGGRCRWGGPCAFTEGPNAEIWHEAADWLPAPDGSAMVHRKLWPEFGLECVHGNRPIEEGS